MASEATLGTIVVLSYVLLGLYNARRRRERGEIPIAKQEGSMLKAIKITMGICFGLVLFYLLFIAGTFGAAVLFGIFPGKW